MTKRPEEALQRAAVTFLKTVEAYEKTLTFFHPANELLRTSTLKKIYAGLGCRAGVPDLIVMLRNGKTLFIELKAGKNGTTDKQDEFMDRLRALGHECHVISADNTHEIVQRISKILRENGAIK